MKNSQRFSNFEYFPRSREIGEILTDSGLAKKEVGEKIFVGEEPHHYYKYVKERNGGGKREGCKTEGQQQHQASLTSRFEDGSQPLRTHNPVEYEDDNVPKQVYEARDVSSAKTKQSFEKVRKYINEQNRRKADTTTDIKIPKLEEVMEKIRKSRIEEEADKK